MALIAAGVTWLLSPSAFASIGLGAAPGGWDEAQGNARERAEAWAEAVSGRVLEAYGPTDGDATDVLVLLEAPGQLPATELEDPTAYLTDYAALFGAEAPATASSEAMYEGVPPVLRARFESGDQVVELAIVSSGSTRGLVILATTVDGNKLYAPLFEDAIEDLSGVAPPPVAFPHRAWWISLLAGWAVATVVLAVIVRAVSGANSPTTVGRRVAMACVLLSAVAMTIAFVALEEAKPALTHSGLSRAWLVAEIGLAGLAAAGVVMIVASIISASVRPIQSAPATGTWAERPATPFATSTARMPTGLPPTAMAPVPITQSPSQPLADLPPLPDPATLGPPTAPPTSLPWGNANLMSAPAPGLPELGAGESSGVSPARTAPIVLRGSDKLSADQSPRPSVPPPSRSTLDKTLVGRAPTAPKPFAFPPPMKPRSTDDGNDGG